MMPINAFPAGSEQPPFFITNADCIYLTPSYKLKEAGRHPEVLNKVTHFRPMRNASDDVVRSLSSIPQSLCSSVPARWITQ